MINKLVVASLLVLAVLYVGDPYAPENKSLSPYLPPAPTDSEILAIKEKTEYLIDSVDMQGNIRAISEHELTTSFLQAIDELKSAVFRLIIEFDEEKALLARAQE